MELNFTYIKKTFTYIFLSLLVLHFGDSASAQLKYHTVVSSTRTSLDDYFQLDYMIENAESVENFVPPSFKNFKIIQGPSQSESVTVINGAMSRSKSITYILTPLVLGSQVIPGATAVINGKSMRSNPVTIEVAKTGPHRSGAPPAVMQDMPDLREEVSEEYRLNPNEDAKSKIVKNLLVKLNVNKQTCYVGEPLMATYKLYSRLRSESRITKRPSLNGFSVYDMEEPSSRNLTVEQYKGKSYNVHVIRRSQLLPIQPGSYVLDPVELDNKVEFVRSSSASSGKGRSSNNPMERMMDDFFSKGQSGELEEHNVTLQSDPVTITVNPLPEENKPDNFNGAVGTFTIRAALKRKIIVAGDAAELEVTIDGAGNLPMINAPHIDLPAGMETFDPEVKEAIDKSAYPLKGSKTISYTFLVKADGDYIIPPVKFSYFDPSSATYKTISSDSLSLSVSKRINAVGIKPSADTAATGIAGTSGSGWTDIINKEMLIVALLILLVIAVVIYLLKRTKKATPVQKHVQAEDAAKAEPIKVENPSLSLTAATTALEQGKSQEFYSEINKGIREAIYRKTSMAPSELPKFKMPFVLREKGVSAQTIQELEAVMKECEIALYTPIHEVSDMKKLLEKADGVITELTK